MQKDGRTGNWRLLRVNGKSLSEGCIGIRGMRMLFSRMVTADYFRLDQSSAVDRSNNVASAITMPVLWVHITQQHDGSIYLQPQLVRWDSGWSEGVEELCGDRHLLFCLSHRVGTG